MTVLRDQLASNLSMREDLYNQFARQIQWGKWSFYHIRPYSIWLIFEHLRCEISNSVLWESDILYLNTFMLLYLVRMKYWDCHTYLWIVIICFISVTSSCKLDGFMHGLIKIDVVWFGSYSCIDFYLFGLIVVLAPITGSWRYMQKKLSVHPTRSFSKILCG